MDIESVKEFDILLDKYNINGNKTSLKVLSVAFAAVSLVFCFIPVDELMEGDFREALMLLLYGVIFSAAALLCHLNRTVTVGLGVNAQGVYSVLKYVPCIRQNLINTRIRRMLKFVGVLLALALFIKVGIDLSTHASYIALDVIAVLVAYGFFPCVIGLGIIYGSLNYKKK